MNRHAYLILAHKNPGQVRKLVELLDDPRNDIFVHIDRKAGAVNGKWELGCSASRLVLIDQRYRVNWGGVSIMKAELSLLKAATAAGHYAYYHLLSGMDLPIKDQDTIHAFFEANDGREFLNLWTADAEKTDDRYRYAAAFPEGEGNFITHGIGKCWRILQKRLGLRINEDVDFHYGSQWFSITDGLARYVVSRSDWLLKTFGRTIICDEVFLPTVLWDSPYRNKLYDSTFRSPEDPCTGNLRYIDWTRKAGSGRHPHTFRSEDLDTLMSVPHLWARKFDETIDKDIIDSIYERLRH